MKKQIDENNEKNYWFLVVIFDIIYYVMVYVRYMDRINVNRAKMFTFIKVDL